jgi:hypothetical protein
MWPIAVAYYASVQARHNWKCRPAGNAQPGETGKESFKGDGVELIERRRRESDVVNPASTEIVQGAQLR